MKKLFLHTRTAMMVAFGTVVIAVVIAFAPSTWTTMMLRSFLPQWITLFALAAIWLLLRRRWRDGLVTAAGGLLILPTSRPPQIDGSTGSTRELRIAHFNVLQTNSRYAEVIAAMVRSDADLIGVQEVDPEWASELIDRLSAAYPHRVIEPRTNCYGIALFSRIPLTDIRLVRLGASPAISAGLTVENERMRLLYLHTSSPGSPAQFAARNSQLRMLENEVTTSRDPVLVVGDLNAAPWDRDLRRFLAATGSRCHSSAGDPTFPSLAHMALIPIDHVLSPPEIGVLQRSVHIPGSDHRGLLADICVSR
jgi:endonuclease/exonuclease/phosphatase (EEP) superfamily protein YafD